LEKPRGDFGFLDFLPQVQVQPLKRGKNRKKLLISGESQYIHKSTRAYIRKLDAKPALYYNVFNNTPRPMNRRRPERPLPFFPLAFPAKGYSEMNSFRSFTFMGKKTSKN
jgi:hypothetical protein